MNILALAFILASLHIPQTNDKTLQQEPLKLGEIAFVGSDDGANVKVGSGSFLPWDVYDKSALRGYSLSKLGRGDYIVNCSSNLTYNKAQNKWTATGIDSNSVYQIWFTCKNDIVLNSFEVDTSVNVGEMIPSSNFEMEYEISGNILTATFTYPGGVAISGVIDNPIIESRNFGDPNHVTDLTESHFMMKDELGDFDLASLRSGLLHFYDGNRGDDWSKYRAVENVRMQNNHLVFGWQKGANQLFNMGVDDVNTNSVIQRLNGLDAVHYYMSNEESYTNGEYLAISSANTNILTIAVSNITNFAVENLHIYSSDSLEEGNVLWKAVPYSVISTNENSVTVEVERKQNGFYSAYYTANVPVVDVKGRLSVGGMDIIDVIDTMSGATAENVVKDATNALATVAHTGNYNDLSNKPSIPTQYTDAMASNVVTNVVTKSYVEGTAANWPWSSITNPPTIPPEYTDAMAGVVATNVVTNIVTASYVASFVTNSVGYYTNWVPFDNAPTNTFEMYCVSPGEDYSLWYLYYGERRIAGYWTKTEEDDLVARLDPVEHPEIPVPSKFTREHVFTNVLGLAYLRDVPRVATNVFESLSDYALTNLTGSTISLASGEIGNLYLDNVTSNLTINLNFSSVTNRSGDAMLYLVNDADTFLAIGPASSVTPIGYTASDAIKAGTNIVLATRMAYENGKSVIMVDIKEVK